MVNPPTKDNDYLPEHAEQLDASLTGVSPATATAMRNAADSIKLNALRSLVQALDSGFKIGFEHYVDGQPEPYPGAAATVMRQCRDAIALARKTGLMPHVES